MTIRNQNLVRVLIVDDNRTTAENVARLLNFEPDIEVIGQARNGRIGVEMTQRLTPDLVLMDINMPDMDGIEATRRILDMSPHSRVMMMSVQADMEYLKGAMQAGAREFLIKPFGYDELIETVRRVHRAEPSPAELAALAAPRMEVEAAEQAPQVDRAVMIALFSPKGGVGCSTIAANLAIALRGSREARVLLVDGDVFFGDLGAMLDLRPDHRLVDALNAYDPDDLEVLQRMFVSHASGINLLAGTGRPELAELVQPQRMRALLDGVKQVYDYLVLDIGCRYDALSLQMLDLVDRAILVITPEVTALKNVNLFLKTPEPRRYPPGKIVPLINKYHQRWGISPESVGSTIGHQVRMVIPEDETSALAAVNRGRPVILSASRSPMVKPLLDPTALMPDKEQLAEELAELAAQKRSAPPPPIRQRPIRRDDRPRALIPTHVDDLEPKVEREGCARWIPFLNRQ
jgi:pilus assembly protein CpaE